MKKQLIVDLIDTISTMSTVLEGEKMKSKKVHEALKDLGDNEGFKELQRRVKKASNAM